MNNEKEPSGNETFQRLVNLTGIKIDEMAGQSVLIDVVGGEIPLIKEAYLGEGGEEVYAILEEIQIWLGFKMAIGELNDENLGSVIKGLFEDYVDGEVLAEGLTEILKVVQPYRLVEENSSGEVILNAFTAEGWPSRQVILFEDDLERGVEEALNWGEIINKYKVWEAWYYYFDKDGKSWCYLVKEEGGVKKESLWNLGTVGSEEKMESVTSIEGVTKNGFEVVLEKDGAKNPWEVVEVMIQKVYGNGGDRVVDQAVFGFDGWSDLWLPMRQRSIRGREGDVTMWLDMEEEEDFEMASLWLEWEDGWKVVGKIALRDSLLPAQEIVNCVLEEVSGGVSERELGDMWREYPTLNLRSEDQRNREIFGEVLVVIYKGKEKVRLEKLMVGGVVLEGKLSKGDEGEWLIEAEIPKGVMVRSGTSWDWDGQRVEDLEDIPREEKTSMVRVWLDEDTGEVGLEIVYINGN